MLKLNYCTEKKEDSWDQKGSIQVCTTEKVSAEAWSPDSMNKPLVLKGATLYVPCMYC